jgi:hypothetical protein
MERAQAWPTSAFEDARRAVDKVSLADLRHHLEELLRLLSDAADRGPHHYIRFVGD